MTTVYHTPYPFGGALTAAAMTAPLGQLDAAIADVETYYSLKSRVIADLTLDGTTDDTTGVNAIVSAANTAGGGIVIVPAHTTVVVDDVVLRSNVILRGEGPSSVLKLKASTIGDVVKSAATSAATAISFAGIENLTIDGNKSNQTANNDAQQYGISLHGANDCWVTNCWVKDTKRSGIYFAGARNRAENNHLTGIGATGSAGSIIGRQGIQFDNYNSTEIIADRSIARGNRVVDCLEHGIKVYDLTTGSIVANNIVQAAGDKGIEVMGASCSSIIGNTVNGASVLGILVGDATHAGTDSTVSGNAITGTLLGTSGGHGILVQNQTGVIVSGNSVAGSVGNGIYVLNSRATSVTGNTCRGNGTGGSSAGITFYQSPNGSITGNTCVNNGTTGSRGSGILLWDAGTANTDIAITGNRCYDTGSGAAKVQAYGIDSRDASTALVVSANALRGNFEAAGLTLVGTNVTNGDNGV